MAFSSSSPSPQFQSLQTQPQFSLSRSPHSPLSFNNHSSSHNSNFSRSSNKYKFNNNSLNSSRFTFLRSINRRPLTAPSGPVSIPIHKSSFSKSMRILQRISDEYSPAYKELVQLWREKVSVKELMTVVKNMMWNAEIAIRLYMMLRPRFLHQNASTISNNAGSQSLGATGNSGPSNQPNTNSMAPLYDFYYGLPKRPSPFMQHMVSRFEKYLVECCQWIEELEQLVESLHQYIESMKTAYLADQRRRSGANDLFLEADRRETAKQEAAARRIHPTLHLPANSAQPSTQVAGLLTSSSTPGSSVPQQSIVGTSGASSGSSGSSLFNTPTAPSSTPSLFSTPITSTPASNLFGDERHLYLTFGTPGISPQSTPFGTYSTFLFGSAQTPLLFGSSPSLASTPAAGSSPFSTPTLTQGAATGSGSSFGAASKSSRPKSCTARR